MGANNGKILKIKRMWLEMYLGQSDFWDFLAIAKVYPFFELASFYLGWVAGGWATEFQDRIHRFESII